MTASASVPSSKKVTSHYEQYITTVQVRMIW